LSLFAGEQQVAKELAEAWKERYEAAVRASGSILYDSSRRTGHVVYGGACEAILGYTHDELCGDISKWVELIHPDDRDFFAREVDRTNADLTPYKADYRMTRKDGKTIWLRDDGHFTFRAKNQPSDRIIGLVRDVSQQRENEKKVAILSQRLETLIDNTPLAVIEWDSDFRITRWSGQAHRTFGWSATEIVGRELADVPFVSKTDLPQFKSSIELLNASDESFVVFTSGNVHQDGSEIACQWYNSVLHDSEGRLVAVLSLVLDITERNNAEADLRESEELFRQLTDAMPQVVWMATNDGEVNYYNFRVQNLAGVKRRADGTWEWKVVLHPDDRQRTLEAWAEAIETKTPYQCEHRVRLIDGSYRWHLSRALPAACGKTGETRWFGSATDIHDLKMSQVALRESEDRFRAFMDNNPACAYLKDDQGRYLFVNRMMERSSGRPLADWIGNSDVELLPISEGLSGFPDTRFSSKGLSEKGAGPLRRGQKTNEIDSPTNGQPPLQIGSKDADAIDRMVECDSTSGNQRKPADTTQDDSEASDRESVGELPAQDDGRSEAELSVEHVDGRRHYLTFSFPVKGHDGRQMLGGVSLDITDRKLAELQAEADRERVQLVADAVPALISYIDADARYCLINHAYEAWFGAERGEMIGREMREVIGEAAWEAILPHVDAVLAGNLVTYEAHVPYRKGGTRWISATYTPDLCKDGGVRGFVAHVNDITARRRAEDELKYQRSLLQAITDNAQTSIFLMDEAGRGLFVNPAAEEMTGYSASELIGNRLAQVIHRSQDPQSLHSDGDCPLLRHGADIQPVRNQTDIFVHRDGHAYPVLWNARAVFRDGKAIATIAEVWDVTKEKQAEQDLQAVRHSLETIIETAPTLIVLINAKGEICMFNRACELLTGYSRDEVIGQQMVELLVPNGDRQVLLDRFRAAEVAELCEPHENHWVTRSGEHRLVEWRCTRLNPGGAQAEPMLLGIGVDVTSRRMMEDELRDQAERLAETDRRKDEFIATLAHELRNPLAPIRMGLELLKMAGSDSATLESTRMMMERQTLQLITLVDDLLDVSRITRGKLELRRCAVALSEVVQSAIEACRPGVAEAGHDLQVIIPPEPIYLEADPNRLAQVLSNLLNNASKYTPPGGRIRVAATCEAGKVSIVVEDNGVGIPPVMQQQIFDMFAQIDRSIERGYTGLGIGLTLVKSLVELHGGTIEVFSEGTDCGSRFTVTIPMGTAEVQSVASIESDSVVSDRRSCRVIVVDDNRAAVDMLSQVVRLQGHDVRVANNGEEAIEIAATFLPHAMLMDIGMPRMDGHEAARVIRSQPWGKDVLLIALTGWGQGEDRRRTKEAGFDYHLVKPAEPSEIARLLSLSRRP
jgi:PAS domain S-box-containing protein